MFHLELGYVIRNLIRWPNLVSRHREVQSPNLKYPLKRYWENTTKRPLRDDVTSDTWTVLKKLLLFVKQHLLLELKMLLFALKYVLVFICKFKKTSLRLLTLLSPWKYNIYLLVQIPNVVVIITIIVRMGVYQPKYSLANLLTQQIRKRYYQHLGTSLINSSMLLPTSPAKTSMNN